MSSKRLTGKILTSIAFVGIVAFIPNERDAQPVTIPGLNPPSFQSQDLDPYFQQAAGNSAVQGWDSVVYGGAAQIRAAWEAQVDAEINTAIAGINASDPINSNAEYQNYVRNALLIQREQALGDWERQADTLINMQRGLYIASLASGTSRQEPADEAERNLQSIISSANLSQDGSPFENAEKQFAMRRQKWETDFQTQLEKGWQEYQGALAGIDADYAQRIGEIDQADQQFQQNLAMIKSYEQNVRDAMGLQVQDMQNYLQAGGMFYETNCNAQNICTATGTLTTAGQELQTLIQNLQQGLANNAPLSVLTQQMVTYLTTQRQAAEAQETYWDGQAHTTYNQGALTVGNVVTNGATDAQILSAYTQYGADIIYAYQTGDMATLNGIIASKHGHRTLEQMLTADMQGTGYHPPPGLFGLIAFDPFPVTSYRDGIDESFSATKGVDVWQPIGVYSLIPNVTTGLRRVFTFYACGLGAVAGVPVTDCEVVPEQNAVFNLSYKLFDANADANRITWQGYKNNLAASLNTWQNTLLPSIQNWEAQVQEYQNRYSAWQAQSAVARVNLQNDYQAARDVIVADQSQWLAQMEDQYRAGKRRLAQVSFRLSDAASKYKAEQERREKAGGHMTAEERKQAEKQIEQILRGMPGEVRGGANAQAALDRAREMLPDLSRDFLSAGSTGLPDADILRNYLKEVGRFTNTAMNVALAKQMNEDAKDMQADASKQMLDYANSLNGEVWRSLNPDKMIKPEFKKQVEEGRKNNKNFKITSEMISDEYKNAKDEGFNAKQNPDGSITVTRMVPTGQAVLKPMGDPTKSEDYIPLMRQDTMIIAGPSSMRLASTGSLTDSWNPARVMDDFQANQKAYQQQLADQSKYVEKQVESAGKALDMRTDLYVTSATQQADIASKIVDLAKTLLTGGTLGGWVQGQVNGMIAAAIEERTGIPAGLVSALLGGAKPKDAMKSYVQDQIWAQTDKAIEQATGIPGLGSLIRSSQQQKAAAKAAKRAQQEMVAKVAVTVAATAVGGPAGYAIMSAAMAADGYQKGGTKGAVVGAIGGAASMATGGAVNMSYSRDGGFSASVGYSSGAFTGKLSYNEHRGISASASLSGVEVAAIDLNTSGKLTSTRLAGIELRNQTREGLLGQAREKTPAFRVGVDLGPATVGLSYNKKDGYGGFVGVGSDSGAHAEITYAEKKGYGLRLGAGNEYSSAAANIEFNWNRKGGYTGADLTAHAGNENGRVAMEAHWNGRGGFTGAAITAEMHTNGTDIKARTSWNGRGGWEGMTVDATGQMAGGTGEAHLAISNRGAWTLDGRYQNGGLSAAASLDRHGVRRANVNYGDGQGDSRITFGGTYERGQGFTASGSYGDQLSVAYSQNQGLTLASNVHAGNYDLVGSWNSKTGGTASVSTGGQKLATLDGKGQLTVNKDAAINQFGLSSPLGQLSSAGSSLQSAVGMANSVQGKIGQITGAGKQIESTLTAMRAEIGNLRVNAATVASLGNEISDRLTTQREILRNAGLTDVADLSQSVRMLNGNAAVLRNTASGLANKAVSLNNSGLNQATWSSSVTDINSAAGDYKQTAAVFSSAAENIGRVRGGDVMGNLIRGKFSDTMNATIQLGQESFPRFASALGNMGLDSFAKEDRDSFGEQGQPTLADVHG